VAYFFKIYCYTNFQELTLNGVSGASTLDVHMNVMLLLFVLGNQKVQRWSNHEWHDHTNLKKANHSFKSYWRWEQMQT
jgi:hypothetical protein